MFYRIIYCILILSFILSFILSKNRSNGDFLRASSDGRC